MANKKLVEAQEQRLEHVEEATARLGNALTGGRGHVVEGVDELAEAAGQGRRAREAGGSLVYSAEVAVESAVHAGETGATQARETGDAHTVDPGLNAAHPGAPKPRGLVHLYCGDGKGKTTAAMGLALRALGHGRRVTVVQFLKDGTSGEIGPLSDLGAAVFAGKAPGFVFQMTDDQKAETRLLQNEHLKAALELESDLLVLDEACAAWSLGMVDHDLLKKAVLERPEGCEVVLTGRDPASWMRDAADYITEMRVLRHPYDRGVPAREGVEF